MKDSLFRMFSTALTVFLFVAGFNGVLFASETADAAHAAAAVHHLPPVWTVIPFGALLLMIATGPLFYHSFWEHNYPKVSLALAAIVAGFYGFFMDHGTHVLLHTLEEYISFMALIGSLFIVSGGILIRIEQRGRPTINAAILFLGAILADIIGTTGASMLLIRPYMRINEGRIQPFHIVFFIIIISNIGGGLTPIGDPPLFLGFLKGVPFFWILSEVWLIWLGSIVVLLAIFMVLDKRAGAGSLPAELKGKVGGGISITGRRNFIFLLIIIIAVFLDPAVISGFPSLQKMFHLPFGIRELIMGFIAYSAYRSSNPVALRGNEFNFEPIKEVGFLFIGIFATMIPALELIGAYAQAHAADFSVSRFYWLTGLLSGVLDNAPTYLNFLAGSMGKFGSDIGSVEAVREFSSGVASPIAGDVRSDVYLLAISVAAVFFGAMTYIGNAPNFMVKNIAEQADVDVPSFVEYIYKYSIPLLVPVFFVIWLLFFNY
ncbi:citrate transporter [Prosthecochloris sp. GSB1]|uniref:sodium:proton antiporter n=1 Tax=Prosthecochloris sp. GSB1 TaxID=281093 RepID=UPI000B8D051B|nr:sodium:proton antiporter [Prosthecochloris sp. GSB1]ASQ89919.1 citrate transporter [Prosthecochloris sp. GSB1]